MLRFSDEFALGKCQAELDFVDIPLNTDIPLFVDPYALSVETDPWFIQCSNLVVGFFERLIGSIKRDDTATAISMLLNLHEPNETHLGYSSWRPAGRGIGAGQADDLYRRLRDSKAAQTGMLSDLADCELVIPGISSDKISDITINILRGKFVEYTELQCLLYGLPAREGQSGRCWDSARRNWVNRYARLPVHSGQRLVLVPKAAVRYRLAADHQEYYRDFVLDYLQAEHLEAGSALVTVLKSGKSKVYKKDLSQAYPRSKAFLFEFSEEHPDVLERYKRSLVGKTHPLEDESIEERQPEPRPVDVLRLIDALRLIPPGKAAAHTYHDFILGALLSIFYPQLRNPAKEERIEHGRKRIDIVFSNGAKDGLFFDIIAKHGVRCPYAIFECKNYSSDPGNPEVDQLRGRFSNTRGRFGVLVCRTIADKATMLERCRDVLHAGDGYILHFDDSDIVALLELRAKRDHLALNDYLDDKLRKLVM
jgi:hypothetical protein